jgi:hypothetical protein
MDWTPGRRRRSGSRFWSGWRVRSLQARSRGRDSNSKPSSESSMSPDSAHQRSERMEPERSEEEPNPWRTNSLRHGCLFSGRLVRRTRAESRPSNAEGSREFRSPSLRQPCGPFMLQRPLEKCLSPKRHLGQINASGLVHCPELHPLRIFKPALAAAHDPLFCALRRSTFPAAPWRPSGRRCRNPR